MTRATIDYAHLYSQLYIAYNSWYQHVTRASTNRDAIQALKKRFVIWIEYEEQRALTSLRVPFQELVSYCHKNPCPYTNLYWSGILSDAHDWRNLIECWYIVRCRLLHGESVDTTLLRLCYETLFAFMDEITNRMSKVRFLEDLWSVDMIALPKVQPLYDATIFDSILIVDDMTLS